MILLKLFYNIFRANQVILSRTWSCKAVWCFIQPPNEPPIDVYTEKKYHIGVALDGTTCDIGHVCLAGECVPAPYDYEDS